MQYRSMKQHLGGSRYLNNKEVEMVLREWLRMQQPGFLLGRNFQARG